MFIANKSFKLSKMKIMQLIKQCQKEFPDKFLYHDTIYRFWDCTRIWIAANWNEFSPIIEKNISSSLSITRFEIDCPESTYTTPEETPMLPDIVLFDISNLLNKKKPK